MRNIVNKTDFAAGQHLTQDGQTGESLWIAALKASFSISKNGELTIAEEQAEVVSEPVYRDDEKESSLLYESDFVIKPKIDLLLNAQAQASENEKTTKQLVGVRLNRWSKFLYVYGSRQWIKVMGILTQTEPRPFKSVPIVYENAFGGIDELSKNGAFDIRNPVGKGFADSKSHLTDLSLPQVENPDYPTRKTPKKNHVAGFGPISSHWQQRHRYAGTYDKDWQESRFPLLPLDFDPQFYQSAPEDQVFDAIVGGETMQLIHLYPGVPEINIVIPQIEIGCTFCIDHEKSVQPGRLQTLIVEPEESRLSMVWTASVNCTGKEDSLEFVKFENEINYI